MMNRVLFIYLFISFVFSSDSIGLVMKKKGKVSYTPYSNNEKTENLNISKTLFNQDLIETGKNGFTKFVYLDDGSAIKIHKNSEVYIQGDVRNRKIIKQVNISTGKLKLDVKNQLASEFKIITPTSVASIKGTRFWVDVDGENGDLFYGLSGLVEITNNATGQTINLTENTTARSLPDGTLELKKTVSKELTKLEVLEEEAGEPVNDMPQNNSEDDSGTIIDDNSIQGPGSVNEIIIKLKNSNSEEKSLIIKYIN